MKHLSILFTFILMISLLGTGYAQSKLNYGPRAKSLAGAGSALTDNSIWGNMNPGGQVFLGQKLGLGVDVSITSNSFSVIGDPTEFEPSLSTLWPLGLTPGEYEAENKMNILPQLAFNTKINNESTFGISLYGNGNQGVEYAEKVYFSEVIADFGSGEGFINPMGTVTAPTYFKYNQYFAAFTYSRKFGDNLGIGLSAIGAWQALDVAGLEAFGSLNYSNDPDHLSTNETANSFGFGGKLGVQWNIIESLQVAATFRSKLYMSAFDSYAGLISENGKIDLPSEWSIGVLYEAFDRFEIMLDANRICYSGVPAWGLAMQQGQSVSLGGEDGGGFGRTDQMNYKLGLQYSIPKWSFRGGYQHSDLSLVDNEILLNIMMPDAISDYIAFGLSRKIGKQTINFSVIKGLENTFAGINGLDSQQLVELKSDMWNFEISVEF